MRPWLVLALALGGCGGPDLQPRGGRATGGDWVSIRGEGFEDHGGVIVTFGEGELRFPAQFVVVHGDRLIRARTPMVPVEMRGKELLVELWFADGVTRELQTRWTFEKGLEVSPRAEAPTAQP